MPRLYTYEALAIVHIKEANEIICIPGNGTMMEAIAVAQAGNTGSMNVEKHFDFREAPYFHVDLLINTWVVKRHNRS